MGQVSKFLRSYTDANGRKGYGFWCPGCECMHYIPTDSGAHPVWSFDGNLESPTFSPSLRIFIPAYPESPRPERRVDQTHCHLFVRNGQIDFLGDSSGHELRGLHPMTDLDTIKDYGWGYE